MKKKIKYTAPYLLNPIYPIPISIIGVGGTGSFIAPELASLSHTLRELGYLGFDITLYDDDIVEPQNIGRQKYYECDIGRLKSEVLASRINRAYGDNVKAITKRLDKNTDIAKQAMIISCVDNAETRKIIHNNLKKISNDNNRFKTFYWIDLGNGRDYGQIVMKSYLKGEEKLSKSIIDLHPNLKDDKDYEGCSVALSLSKQSFMINKILGAYTIQLLSDMFINFQIPFTQLYLNLKTLKTNTK